MDWRTTFGDFFDMKKNDLESYLRDTGLKVSGNKRELAQMAFENLHANKSS
jgi:predicted transcriptional regulator